MLCIVGLPNGQLPVVRPWNETPMKTSKETFDTGKFKLVIMCKVGGTEQMLLSRVNKPGLALLCPLLISVPACVQTTSTACSVCSGFCCQKLLFIKTASRYDKSGHTWSCNERTCTPSLPPRESAASQALCSCEVFRPRHVPVPERAWGVCFNSHP